MEEYDEEERQMQRSEPWQTAGAVAATLALGAFAGMAYWSAAWIVGLALAAVAMVLFMIASRV